MTIKRLLTVNALSIFTSLLPFHQSHAARIYNEMSIPVTVIGFDLLIAGAGPSITISPNERSDSLSWPKSAGVTVRDDEHNVLCQLQFGLHAQIVGGNYMVVEPKVGRTSCFVCDSNHALLSGSGQCQ